jgi:hypothetical protein
VCACVCVCVCVYVCVCARACVRGRAPVRPCVSPPHLPPLFSPCVTCLVDHPCTANHVKLATPLLLGSAPLLLVAAKGKAEAKAKAHQLDSLAVKLPSLAICRLYTEGPATDPATAACL